MLAAAADRFAARAAETERLGKLPPETVAELIQMGVPKMMMPARWGGSERDLAAVVEMVTAWSKACLSTAWCAGIFAEHSWVLAHAHPEAQAEVWSSGPDQIVCMSIAAAAEVTPAPGGFRLSGQWRFVSGCDYAGWFLLAAPPGLLLLPRADLAIDHDSWRVSGLCGTGSKTVLVDNAFVPAHRALELTNWPAPGVTPDMPALFRQPIGSLGHALAAVAVGGAEAALELFQANAARRVLHHQGTLQTEDPAAHFDIAEAAVRIETARLLLRHGVDFVRGCGEQNTSKLSPLESARLRMYKSHVVRLCVEAVDRLFAAGGGGALQQSHPLQRIWRDVHAVQAHAGLTWANHARNFGAQMVGLPPTNRPLF
jgi:alkylation response protein AidB-like acyl-CoA dehydrogenase